MSRKKRVLDTTVAVAAQANPASVETFIQQAITSNVPIETMEKLFALRAQVKEEAAREAFVQALAEFQAACPTIKKTKRVLNKNGTLRYVYAPIDSVVEQIKTALAASRLSYSWDTKHDNDHMEVVCKLTHVFGHSETSTIEIPITKSEFMTSPQSYATAQTYAKRYTLLNALGISTADEDTDATDSKKQPDAKSPKAQIIKRLQSLNEKTDTPEQIKEAIKRLTGLESSPDTHEQIADRLQTIIDENNQA